MFPKLKVFSTNNNPLPCMYCHRDTFAGVQISEVATQGKDGKVYIFNPVACFECVRGLGAMAGFACVAMDIGAENDNTVLDKLTLGYWQGLATARDQVNLNLNYGLAEVQEQKEGLEERLKAIEHRLQNPPQPSPPGPQYCYLMRRPNGHHKIGISNDVDRRHDQIRRDHPGTSLIGWFDCDDMRQAERMLHDQFAEKRQDGEWFDLSTDEVDYIVSIGRFAAGEFWQRTSPESLNKTTAPTEDEQPF